MKSILLASAVVIAWSAVSAQAATVPDYVEKAVSDPSRPKADSDRDALRAPAATLTFAGIKPGMKVAEFIPGGGYYTRLLGDVVGPQGKVYGIENKKWDDGTDAKMAAEPGRGNISIQAAPFGQFTLPEKVDVFWTTQNYHDLHIAKYGPVDMADFNKRVHDALKPHGLYIVLDHQANPGTSEADIAKLHRIEKSKVIAEVTAAGFKLAGEDDALHRAADDHTLSIEDQAVKGRTDQFILKFERD